MKGPTLGQMLWMYLGLRGALTDLVPIESLQSWMVGSRDF